MKHSMKIVLVSWHFPPVNSIAGVRIGKAARHLGHSGHDIRVITAAKPDRDCSLPLEIAPERVLTTRFLDIDRAINPFTWWRAVRRTARTAPAREAASNNVRRRSWRDWPSRLYQNLIFCPDRYVGWLLPLCRELDRLCATWQPDLILVSGPPFSPYLAVAFVARRRGIPWVAEFRDRWADDPYTLAPPWRHRVDRWLEARIVRQATGIVTVSEPWSRLYARKYHLPIATVMNGFDPADFDFSPPPRSSSLPLLIVYTGFVYPERRDPSVLFHALLKGGFAPEEVRVLFYGSRSAYLEAKIDELGVEAFVEVHDPVPYAEALRLQSGADVLLLLQWNHPTDEGNVPGKIFEYLAVKRPVLGLGPENGIPAQLIRERRAGLFSNDISTIAGQLGAWIQEKRSIGRVAELPALSRQGLSRDEQYARLETFLSRIAVEATWSDRGRSGPSMQAAHPLERTMRSPFFRLADSSLFERPILCVIIDTEAEFDWTGPFARDEHKVAAVHEQWRVQPIFDAFRIRPTYLVDYPIAADAAASRVLRDLLERGLCDVGVQLHSWTNPPFEELLSVRNSYMCNLSRELQQAKLECLIEAARRSFALEPTVFKAGRYGFADDSAELLEEFGFLVDTSVLPFTKLDDKGPSFWGVPDRPFWFGQHRPVLELPVTRNFTGLLRSWRAGTVPRWLDSHFGRRARLPGIFARLGLLDRLTLTPEGIKLDDLRSLTRALIAEGQRIFTFSFHSPSLAAGNTPYVRTDEDLSILLKRIKDYMEFFFEDLGGQSMTAVEIHDALRRQWDQP
jgi:glycosyltransferase involved in cell wall biosynthesis